MKNYFLIAVTSLFMVAGNNAADTTSKASDGNVAYLKNKPAGFGKICNSNNYINSAGEWMDFEMGKLGKSLKAKIL